MGVLFILFSGKFMGVLFILFMGVLFILFYPVYPPEHEKKTEAHKFIN